MPTPPDHPPLFQPTNTNHAETVGAGASPAPEPAPLTTGPGPDNPTRELLRVEEAAARLAIGRTSMFALIRDEVIASVKLGRLRRVPADAITAYITRLTADQRPAAA